MLAVLWLLWNRAKELRHSNGERAFYGARLAAPYRRTCRYRAGRRLRGLPLPGAILRTEDRELAAAGARLGGLLQYPNTFGAVMAAAMLERLTALGRLPSAAFTRAAGWRGYWTGVLGPVFALACCCRNRAAR